MDGAEIIRRHVAHMTRRGLRPTTVTYRIRALRRLEIHASRSLLHIHLDDLRAYLDALPDAGYRSAETSHFRGFFKWATIEGYVHEDPTYRLERTRRRKYLPNPMPVDDVARALQNPPARIANAMWLAAYAGLRACDLAPLRREHLMIDARVPTVFVEESKGGKPRTVPLAPLLVEALRLPRSGWLFPYHDGRSGHITAHYMSMLCNAYLHDLGIDHTLHTLRHRFITDCYAVDRDLVVTQELAGHESIEMTRRYTWTDPGAAANTVAQLPDPRRVLTFA